MKAQLREKAIELRRTKQLSYGELRKRLGVSKSTLSRWLVDYPLSDKRILELRRAGWSKGEASRERFRNAMRHKRARKEELVYQKHVTLLKRLPESALYIGGLMLYLGEGNKKDPYTIAVANTDPRILRYYMRWLDKSLGIEKKYLKVQLHLYENMDIEKEKKFWENTLCLTDSQFYKTQVRPMRKGSFSYKESFRHGTCQMIYHSGEKKMELTMALRAFLDLYT